MRLVKFFLLGVMLAAILSGCASSHMKPATQEQILSYAPKADEAVVIFMRPSAMAYAVQSSVFDVTTNENVLVGIVSSKSKIAYKVSPGEHLFMVVGESADFMKAYLDAGKTYYALVTPRIGAWKARFSLKPIHKEDLTKEDFKDWERSCHFVENTESSNQWAKENAPSIQTKRESYYEKWLSKPDSDKPVLKKEDGI